MNSKIRKALIRPLVIASLVVLAGGCFISQPTFRRNSASAVVVNQERLKAHVIKLSQELHPRDARHTNNLNQCAEYINDQLIEAGALTSYQNFNFTSNQFKNVIGRFGEGKGSKIIIGAHYDGCGDTPGADDNASGVAALIELAHLFGQHPPERAVELVAYSLEEPPFFGTDFMGSVTHAESIVHEKDDITGVIVLEMVGCFSDERGSQSLPVPLLRLFYPSRGNFIAVIGQWDQGEWIKEIKAGMKGATDLPVYSMRAPASVQGIDFSDHRNYWPHGIKAIMVTDTAFYRNRNYHTSKDTADRLDYTRMSKVVTAVFEAARVAQ